MAYCAVCNLEVEDETCQFKVEDKGEIRYFCTEEHRQEYLRNNPGAKAVE